MIRIVLADDHHLMRQGIRALLQTEPDFCIVGEASDGLETCQLVKDLDPDVLLVSLRMPSLSGLEVARQVLRRLKRIGVVILSIFDDETHVLEALRSGVAGYLSKDSTATDLVKAVRDVSAAQHYLSQSLFEYALEAFSRGADVSTLDKYQALTRREREVLHLVAEGHTNAEAARRLLISQRTVEQHRANMMRKLGLKSRTDLIRYAMHQGILPSK